MKAALLPLRQLIPAVLLVGGLTVASVSLVLETVHAGRETDQIGRERANIMASILSGEIEAELRRGDQRAASVTLSRAVTERDLLLAILCDENDRVVAATRRDLVGKPVGSTPLSGDAPLFRETRIKHASTSIVRGETALSLQPVRLEPTAREVVPLRVGVLGLALDLTTLQDHARVAVWRRAVVVLGLVSLLGLIVGLPLHFALTRRVARLVATTRQIALEPNEPPPPLPGRDELATISRAITALAIRVQESAAALRHREQLFRSAFEYAPTGMALISPEGRLSRWNDALLTMLGLSPDELGATTLIDLTHEEDRAALRSSLESLRPGAPAPAAQELRLTAKDGALRYATVAFSLLGDAGGPGAQVIAHVQDVTPRRRAEEEHARVEHELREAQRLESIGRLAGGIAHDFNNLLTVIIGTVELLEGALPEDSPHREDVDQIGRAASRAASLTRQLLAFSRKQGAAPRVLDLNERVRDMEQMLGRLLGEHIVLRTALSPDVGPVRADPTQIEQVLMNLVLNARDAMPKGGTITIETRNAIVDDTTARAPVGVAPGPLVSLSVADTGTGISAETRAHIFEPFFTTKPAGQGTGLGLAVVYGIVTQNGGSISVESTPGRGSTFTATFPRVEQPVSLRDTGPHSTVAPPSPRTILVAEDDDQVRVLTVRALAGAGHQVIEARNGREALRLAERHPVPIDLVVTDVAMPEMDGRTLAERLRESRPELKVLFVSGYTGDSGRAAEELAELGLLLPKPFRPEQLLDALRRLLSGGSSA